MMTLLTRDQIDALHQRHIPDPEWPDSDDADFTALLSHARASVERIEELREKLRRQAESHESIHLMLKSGIETITPQGWQAIASQCQKYAHEDRA